MAAIEELLAFIDRLETLRDPASSHHARRVSNLTIRFAHDVTTEILDFQELGQAATLHDIGKLLLPENLLTRKGSLTVDEFEVIKQHTALGFFLIAPLRLGQLIEDGVLYHHENYDGSGYPFGLIGEAIPITARIIRIVDMYDALITTRPYRMGYSHQNAMQIMLENQNCFDPKLFRGFLKTIRANEISNINESLFQKSLSIDYS